MNARPKYKTKQRQILLGYLESVRGEHVTANDACAYFRENHVPIGQSTVYRQLESLVEEGVLNKYVIESNGPACFEFVPPEKKGASRCFHCKCEKCGRLIHLRCEELEGIQAHLYDGHHFQLDPLRTVFYGVCDSCQGDGPGAGAIERNAYEDP